MSLTDLRGEVLEKIDETLKFWDERERVSLAGLRRQVIGIIWGTWDGTGRGETHAFRRHVSQRGGASMYVALVTTCATHIGAAP